MEHPCPRRAGVARARTRASFALAAPLLAACVAGGERGEAPSPGPAPALLVAATDAALGTPAGAAPAPERAGAHAAADLRTADLAALVAHALRANPSLRAARAEREALEERLPEVRALPDPRASARWFAQEVETRVGPQEFALGLQQPLPALGARDRAAEVVHARVRNADARLRALARGVAREVRVAWTERWELERRVAVVAESVRLFETLQDVLRPLYASGEARYTDVVRTAVELGRLQDRLRALEDRRLVLDARLNAALGRAPAAPLPAPPVEPPAAALADLRVDAARDPAVLAGGSPELVALAQALAARTAELQVAEHARALAFTLGVEWIATGPARAPGVRGSGDDPIAATLALELPLRTARYDARERAARAEVRAAVARLEDARAALGARLAEERYRLRDAERRIALFEDELLPRADEAFDATQAGFHAGNASFTDVVDTERVRLELQLELARARADLAIALARVFELVGDDETSEEERP